MKYVEKELFEEHDYTNALLYFQQLGEKTIHACIYALKVCFWLCSPSDMTGN